MVTLKRSLGEINEYYGLSTDEKPVYVPNASTFYEMDTASVYMYSAATDEWLKQ